MKARKPSDIVEIIRNLYPDPISINSKIQKLLSENRQDGHYCVGGSFIIYTGNLDRFKTALGNRFVDPSTLAFALGKVNPELSLTMAKYFADNIIIHNDIESMEEAYRFLEEALNYTKEKEEEKELYLDKLT